MTPPSPRVLSPRLLTYSHATLPELVIDTNPDRLSVDVIHTYLSTESYWSQGIPRDIVERAIQGSLVWGIYDGDSQVGYARAVTDRVTFAWLCDVFVLPSHQGKGLGKWLIQTVQSHPVALAQCKRFFEENPKLKPVIADDTAGSVREIVRIGDPKRAAIAGQRAAELYGGLIIRRNIQDQSENYTRFVLVSAASQQRPKSYPASKGNTS